MGSLSSARTCSLRKDDLKPTAIRVDLGAIFVSLGLSRSKWLISSLSPGGSEKMSNANDSRRHRRPSDAVCLAQDKGAGPDWALLSHHRGRGGRARRLPDPPRAAGRGDRKPRRRCGFDCDLAPGDKLVLLALQPVVAVGFACSMMGSTATYVSLPEIPTR